MKKIFTLCLLLIGSLCGLRAQTTIYEQTFNTGTASDWTLNTTDLSGIGVSSSDNQWIINSVYAGGGVLITVPATADEPSGITGSPESYYLHIYNPEDPIYGVPDNCNFLAAGTSTYFAAMNTAVSTVGYTGVTFSFWWLCQGDAGAYGKVYYRTSTTGSWTAIPGGPSTYYGSSVWAQQTVTSAVFNGLAFLEFGFQFTEDATGNDPAFAVDDVKLVGTLTTSVSPTPSFTENHTTVCQDSCIIFTNTTTGAYDSILWSIPGVTITNPRTSPDTVCFTAAGDYVVALNVYHSGSDYTTSTTISVNATPHPPVTVSGRTFTAPAGYPSYQWVEGYTPVPGATTDTYTTTGSIDTVTLIVDSAGCLGYSSPFIFVAEQVANVTQTGNSFWLSATANTTAIHARTPLNEDATVVLLGISGQVISVQKWQQGTANFLVADDFLPPGIYLLRITGNGIATTLKWAK